MAEAPQPVSLAARPCCGLQIGWVDNETGASNGNSINCKTHSRLRQNVKILLRPLVFCQALFPELPPPHQLVPIRNKLDITCKITILLRLTKKSEDAFLNNVVTKLLIFCTFRNSYNTYQLNVDYSVNESRNRVYFQIFPYLYF